MNAQSLARFQDHTRSVAEALKPGSIQVDGQTYDGAVWQSTEAIDNDRGGQMAVRTLVAHIGKDVLAAAPAIGAIVTHVETGRTYELYQVGGQEGPKWILRAAAFPARRSS